MKRMHVRGTALLLLLAMILSLAACGGGGETSGSLPAQGSESESVSESESESKPDKWETVNFGGEELKVEISANQDYETTFPAADIYTRGPDSLNEDPVQKKVYDRNLSVTAKLGLSIVFSETDLDYNEVMDDMLRKVQMGSADAPDVYINDAYGVSRAMFHNVMVNVMDPKTADGASDESYFDFDAGCWYRDYMLGLTFTPEKQYIVAGDYDIDIIRMAWVFFVNLDLLNENLAGAGYDSEYVYEMVRQRAWDYDTMMYLSETAHKDSVNYGTTDKEDEVIGMTWSHVSAYVFVPTSGVEVFHLDEDGRPFVPETNAPLSLMVEKFRQLYNTMGVYWEEPVLNATVNFMNGNIIFAMSVLGELESEEMRNLTFNKGVVPLPVFDRLYQTEYNTVSHDQAEITAILNTTECFTEASAYLQLINELSSDVLHEYYENTLKLRYNDDPDCRDIIDIVHDTIGSPRVLVLARTLVGITKLPSGVKELIYAVEDQGKLNVNSFASDYESFRDAWEYSFQAGYDIFMGLD